VTESEPTRPPSWRRRIGKRILLTLVAGLAGWVALLVHPEPLFAYTAQEGNVVLHARRPFPPETRPLLEEVIERVSRSPIYDPARVHHVFRCDTPALYGFLALWQSEFCSPIPGSE
jgi:hypothetical protein